MSENSQDLCRITSVMMYSKENSLADAFARQSSADITPKQAENDIHLIQLWLHGRSRNTQEAYARDIRRFMDYNEKELKLTTLGDLQSFADHIIESHLKSSSSRRLLSSVKSLLDFGYKLGYLSFNVGKALKLPNSKDTLAERILSEEQIQNLFDAENNPRNKMILRLSYATAARVSEICSLKWKDCQPRKDGGQISILGKGEKTNNILIPQPIWLDLMALRGEALDESPVFKSRKGGHLDRSQILRIVKKAAAKIGIPSISPHWLRHGHASHALENGAPIHLVQKQLNHSSIATTGRYLHARPTESSSKYLKV